MKSIYVASTSTSWSCSRSSWPNAASRGRPSALGRTQSAVSHSLSRLREQLGDPLLIKGPGRMQPTAFALELMEEARPILRSIQRALSPRHAFDPATSRRLFRFAAPDFARGALHVACLPACAAMRPASRSNGPARRPDAPGNRGGSARHRHRAGGLRLPRRHRPGDRRAQWGCFARRGHPAFRSGGQRHGRAGRIGRCGSATAWQARSTPPPRRPAWNAPSPPGSRISRRSRRFSATSDLLATLPSVAMTTRCSPYGLEFRHVPFPIDPLPHAMLWSARRSNDPEIAWLRDRLGPS